MNTVRQLMSVLGTCTEDEALAHWVHAKNNGVSERMMRELLRDLTIETMFSMYSHVKGKSRASLSDTAAANQLRTRSLESLLEDTVAEFPRDWKLKTTCFTASIASWAI